MFFSVIRSLIVCAFLVGFAGTEVVQADVSELEANTLVWTCKGDDELRFNAYVTSIDVNSGVGRLEFRGQASKDPNQEYSALSATFKKSSKGVKSKSPVEKKIVTENFSVTSLYLVDAKPVNLVFEIKYIVNQDGVQQNIESAVLKGYARKPLTLNCE